MIGTLFRYEFSRTVRPLAIMFGATVALIGIGATIGGVLGPFDQSPRSIVGVIVYLVTAVLTITALWTALQIYLVFDAYRSLHGRGAVMTHSVPVKTTTIFWVKYVWMMLITVIAGLLSGLAILVGLYLFRIPLDRVMPVVGEVISQAPMTALWGAIVVLLGAPLLAGEVLFIVVFGSTGWARRLRWGGPIVTYIIVYVAAQLVIVLGLFLPPTFKFAEGQVGESLLWQGYLPSLVSQENEVTTFLPAGYLVFLFLWVILAPVLSVWRLNRKLEVSA